MELSELYDYDKETGEFFWKVDRFTGRWLHIQLAWAGTKAGSISTEGYVILKHNGKFVKAHRCAWFLSTGEWPEQPIDHINGDRADNRLCNLRLADFYENNHNRKIQRNNKTGVKGVTLEDGRYRTKVIHSHMTYRLGTFTNLEDAKQAVMKKREELHGDYTNHG